MTKKDYELIAENIRRRINTDIKHVVHLAEPLGTKAKEMACKQAYIEGIASTVAALATALAHDNSRFDTSRFIEACGIEEARWDG